MSVHRALAMDRAIPYRRATLHLFKTCACNLRLSLGLNRIRWNSANSGVHVGTRRQGAAYSVNSNPAFGKLPTARVNVTVPPTISMILSATENPTHCHKCVENEGTDGYRRDHSVPIRIRRRAPATTRQARPAMRLRSGRSMRFVSIRVRKLLAAQPAVAPM
jgi:hypothetical protein